MTSNMANVSRFSDAATGAEDGVVMRIRFRILTRSCSTAEEAAILEWVKRVTGGWPVITTTEPPGDQSAGNAGCDSSGRLWDILALCLIRVLNDRRLHKRLFAAMIDHEIVYILFPETFGQYGPGFDIKAEDIFRDGIVW